MNEIVCRIPMPPSAGVSAEQWKVLTEAVWPGAKSPEAVAMALSYCRVRKLDPFRRPVHIVEVWNSTLGQKVETIWPGINEIQTTAARTGQWGGMDRPEWGPNVTRTFQDGSKLTFPEYCTFTVYRMVEGHRCAFSETVFWEETYARKGRDNTPNEMWFRRSRGQLLKCAKAAALRAAFPEEGGGSPTSDEMEGQTVEAGGVVIEGQRYQPDNKDIGPITFPGTVNEQDTARAIRDSISHLDMDKLHDEADRIVKWVAGFTTERELQRLHNRDVKEKREELALHRPDLSKMVEDTIRFAEQRIAPTPQTEVAE